MKKTAFLITYNAALVIGVLMLVFASQANADIVPGTIRGIIIASAIFLIIPGLATLYVSMKPRTAANGVVRTTPWFVPCLSIAALAWGIMLLCIPSLGDYLSITLGITLVIAGLAQIAYIVESSRPLGAPVALYVIPICVVCAGIVVMTLINDYADRGASNSVSSIISGITLLFWAVNGLITVNYKRRQDRIVNDDVRTIDPKN